MSREHLQRVHSPHYRCSDCNHKFPEVSGGELAIHKALHQDECSRTGRTVVTDFDMTTEQWQKCRNWSQNQRVDRGSRSGLSERKPALSWRLLYNSLFPPSRIATGQYPYDKPGAGPVHYHDLPKAQPMEPQIEEDWRDSGVYMPSSLGAKHSGQLQDSGRSSRCMFCKQKLDRDKDAESGLSLSCRKCGEHGMSSLFPCPICFSNRSAKLTINAPPTHHIPAIPPTWATVILLLALISIWRAM